MLFFRSVCKRRDGSRSCLSARPKSSEFVLARNVLPCYRAPDFELLKEIRTYPEVKYMTGGQVGATSALTEQNSGRLIQKNIYPLFSFVRMDTPRELEWYLRDHFFKQASKGRVQLARSAIADEMVSLYLRYKGYDPQELDRLMSPIIDNLVSAQVLLQDEDMLVASSSLFRMQCATCYYVSYLVESEPKTCQRCSGTNMYVFPRKK